MMGRIRCSHDFVLSLLSELQRRIQYATDIPIVEKKVEREVEPKVVPVQTELEAFRAELR